MTIERPPYAWRPVALVVAVQAALLLAMAPHYGPHRDELYFVSAGQRLAWGYPDQPSFTPLLARLSTEVAEHNLVVLRLWSILAVAGLVLLAVQFARLLGGARSAQVLTAVTVAASAVVMTVGHRLSTATFDTLAWTAVLVLVTQALVDDRPRLWLVAGVVAGIGLNNKHAVAFLLLGILVALALDPAARPALRTPWPWIAGCYAVLLWVPNLVWQWRHDWPALELSADIAEEYGGLGGRLGMVGEAFSMFSPFLGVLWVIGLVQLLRRDDWRAARLPAFVFLVVTAVFLVTGGKGYYLAGAIVPLLAAGCTWLAEQWSGRTLVLAGAGLAALRDGRLARAGAGPPGADVRGLLLHEPQRRPGRDDRLGGVRRGRVRAGGRPDQPDGVVVFTGNYGEAGAFEWYGVGAPRLQRAQRLARLGATVRRRPCRWWSWATTTRRRTSRGAPGQRRCTSDIDIDNDEQGGPVWVCDDAGRMAGSRPGTGSCTTTREVTPRGVPIGRRARSTGRRRRPGRRRGRRPDRPARGQRPCWSPR